MKKQLVVLAFIFSNTLIASEPSRRNQKVVESWWEKAVNTALARAKRDGEEDSGIRVTEA